MSMMNYDELLGLAESSLAVTAVVSTVPSTTLTDTVSRETLDRAATGTSTGLTREWQRVRPRATTRLPTRLLNL